MKIKVCGLRNKENILAVDALQPDYLGFIFYPKSPRFVTDESVFRLPTKAQKVAVTVNLTYTELYALHQRTGITHFQLHGAETADLCKQLRSKGLTVIKAVSVADETSLAQARSFDQAVDYLLFDTAASSYGGSGKSFNWDWLNAYTGNTPFFLSGGIGPEDAKKLNKLQHGQCCGVDLNSRFESEKAIKNIPLLQTFLHELRSYNH
jgi:phosphoribosylanthranilate isomerase